MQQVAPSTSLRVVYLIQDHTDTNTYYVRSVIRNSVTGTILSTIDLTDTGNRRFFGTYNTPAAEDMYIDITTTVYSDSGYTIKAQDKYEELQQYLIKTPWALSLGGFGGGDTIVKSEGIDYKKIREIIKDELSKMEEPEDYDDSIINSKLDEINYCSKQILNKKIEFPKPEKPVDLSPVLKAINSIKIPETDYALITNSISNVINTISKLIISKEIHDKGSYENAIKNLQKSENILMAMLETAKSNDKLNKVISDNSMNPMFDNRRIKNLIK